MSELAAEVAVVSLEALSGKTLEIILRSVTGINKETRISPDIYNAL